MTAETEEQTAAEKKKAERAKAAAEAKEKARKAATALARKRALEEAANVIGQEIKNSADQLTTACLFDHASIVQDQWKLLEERVAKARKLITTAGIAV